MLFNSTIAPIEAAAVSSVVVVFADAGRGIITPVVIAAAAPVAIMNLEIRPSIWCVPRDDRRRLALPVRYTEASARSCERDGGQGVSSDSHRTVRFAAASPGNRTARGSAAASTSAASATTVATTASAT